MLKVIFRVDAEQERRKRKDGKGYAKTTPTDPVERTKFYKKRDNQREASKKFRWDLHLSNQNSEEPYFYDYKY